MCAKHGFSSPRIAEGGATRWQSVKNAIDSLDCPPRTVVMIHDGARPLVSVAMIKRLASLDEHCSGVIPTTKLTDSIRQLLPEARHRGESRDKYVAVQTPQAFRAQALKNAYALPYDPAFTDDASVIEASHAAPIALADGESTNIKVTNPLDLVIAEAILAHQTADGSPVSPSAPKATR